MGSPYLNNNETIILSTHNVIISTIPAEAILTNQRLIIVDSRHAQLRPQDIPFSAIETVTIGDTSTMEPELSLSIVMKDETRHSLGIIFSQPLKTRRAGERDEWAVKLKEVSVAAQQEHGLAPAELQPPWVPGPLPEEAVTGGTLKTPDESFRYAPLTPKTSRKAPKRSRSTVIIAVLAVVILVALAAVVYLLAPQFSATGGTPPVPGTTLMTTVPTTAIPTTTEPPVTITPTPVATTIPSTPEAVTTPITVAPRADATQSGVWVRIDYDGTYSASYGTSGRLKEITGAGSQYYQLPAKDEIVEATVQKSDDSGSVMTVSIYNNGVLAIQDTTSSPHGTVELHVDLRETSAPATIVPLATTTSAKNSTITVKITAPVRS